MTRDFQQNQAAEGRSLVWQEVGTASIRRQWGLWVWKVDKVVMCPQQWLLMPASMFSLPRSSLGLG